MAFFSNGKDNFFSLSLAPAGKDRAFVFILTKQQVRVSTYMTRYLLPVTTVLFTCTLFFAIAKIFDFLNLFFTDSRQVVLLIILASTAAIIAYSEVVFFLWVRASRHSLLSEQRRIALRDLSLLKEKSAAAYLVFLLNLAIPALAIAALPGGIPELWTAVSTSGIVSQFFAVQLAVLGTALMVFLIRRTGRLLNGRKLYGRSRDS